MAELDAELSARLSRLAAAVPVASGQLDVVHRDAVRARQQVRMAWLTPLVVLVIGVVAGSVLKVGPFAPGATPQPSGPITGQTPLPKEANSTDPSIASPTTGASATDRDGDFELVLQADKASYRPEDPIEISASLAYLGSAETIDITTDSGGPILFGIREPLFGDVQIGGLSLLTCETTTLVRATPLVAAFQKSGGVSNSRPDAEAVLAWIRDPVLRLPVGTWHVYARVAGPCLGGGPTFEVVADLEILVTEPPGTIEAPTRAPENGGLGNQSMSDSGAYWIEIASDHRIYRESEPISITGTFRYLGDTAVGVQGLRPLVFSVVEPVHGINMDGAVTLECNHDRLLPGQEIHAPFHKAGGVSTLDPEYEAKLAYLQDPVFRLPPGSWHIRVSGWVSVTECGMPQERFSTEIEITVLADAAKRMDLLTESDPLAVAQCRDRWTTGGLARAEGTGLGIEVEPGSVQRILWPYGFSAWDTPDGAILVNEAGQTVAQEGQRVMIDGLDEPGWFIRAGCIRAIVLID